MVEMNQSGGRQGQCWEPEARQLLTGSQLSDTRLHPTPRSRVQSDKEHPSRPLEALAEAAKAQHHQVGTQARDWAGRWEGASESPWGNGSRFWIQEGLCLPHH